MRTVSSIVRVLGRGRIEVRFWRVEVRRESEGTRDGVGCAIVYIVAWLRRVEGRLLIYESPFDGRGSR
jgi:hypothetical protein